MKKKRNRWGKNSKILKVAKKLREKAGDSGENTKEHRIHPIPKRFKLEQYPEEKGERQIRAKEIHALHTEGDQGNKSVSPERILRARKYFILVGRLPKRKNRAEANREKCHPEIANRWASPLF